MNVDIRAVLYTDDMEPITVLELSAYARSFLEKRGRVVLEVMDRPAWVPDTSARIPAPKQVSIWAERFTRNGRNHLMLFTRDDENALLLKAAFLPGQHREVSDSRADAFAKGFLHALARLGQ